MFSNPDRTVWDGSLVAVDCFSETPPTREALQAAMAPHEVTMYRPNADGAMGYHQATVRAGTDTDLDAIQERAQKAGMDSVVAVRLDDINDIGDDLGIDEQTADGSVSRKPPFPLRPVGILAISAIAGCLLGVLWSVRDA